MARIYIRESGEVDEVTCMSDGQDFMSDVIGQYNEGGRYDTERHDADWSMSEDEFNWWSEWAIREERILSKATELGEDAIEGISRLGIEYGDPERLHDAQERYLGI